MNGERVHDEQRAPAAPAHDGSRPAVVERRGRSDAVVQAKMMVGAANDSAEREADRIARDVMESLRRGDRTGEANVSRTVASRVRRAATIGAAGGPVDQDFESRVRAARGSGSPLPAGLGATMESAFGADFSDVRVHSDSQAHELNRTIQARAFTTGSDIFMGDSAPALSTEAGTELLAHELTHVVQQGAGAQRSLVRRDYIHGSAQEDAELFEKEPPVDRPLDTSPGSRAATFGITAGNMPHYLERHTFKYQKLNAKTVSPGAGFFPYTTNGHRTNADDVKAMLDEALAKLPDGTAIGASPVSVPVDLSNGLRVNVGALKSGKLSAFFPIAGGTHPGFHEYTSDELKAIRAAKNAADAGGPGGTT